jgi:hypothetical protein
MSAINNVLFIYFYVRSINFVVCTSASNFLEYIKILPVNKNILLVHLIHLRAAQKVHRRKLRNAVGTVVVE